MTSSAQLRGRQPSRRRRHHQKLTGEGHFLDPHCLRRQIRRPLRTSDCRRRRPERQPALVSRNRSFPDLVAGQDGWPTISFETKGIRSSSSTGKRQAVANFRFNSGPAWSPDGSRRLAVVLTKGWQFPRSRGGCRGMRRGPAPDHLVGRRHRTPVGQPTVRPSLVPIAAAPSPPRLRRPAVPAESPSTELQRVPASRARWQAGLHHPPRGSLPARVMDVRQPSGQVLTDSHRRSQFRANGA